MVPHRNQFLIYLDFRLYQLVVTRSVHIHKEWQKEVNQLNRRDSTSLRINEEVLGAEVVAGEEGVVLEEEEEVGEVGVEVDLEVEVDLVGLGMVREVGVVG